MKQKQKQAEIYELLAGVGHALSNPHRLKILSLLSHGEKTIDELAGLTGQSKALTSAHVKLLRSSRLVAAEKRGRSVHCRLADDRVAELWLQLRDLGEAVVPDIREIMRDSFDGGEELSPLGVHELEGRLESGKVTLLDLRPASEFAEGHIPTARNVPFDNLADLMKELPRRRQLLVYCRGPFCAAAFAGNQQLRKSRFRSQRLRFSVPEWKAAGLPVE